MSKFLPLMREGTFKDRHGKVYNITKGALEKIAAAFDPKSPPHLLVGHPDRPSAPSFGIVDALKVVGDKLFFRPAKFCAEFAALVKRGAFPSVSAGLTNGMSRLDHVAFLSAQKPAIDGLEPIAEFSAPAVAETSSIDVTECADGLAEFGKEAESWFTWKIHDVGTILRNLKNYIIERSNTEEADKVLPEYLVEGLHDDPPAPEPEGEAEKSEFSFDVTQKKVGAAITIVADSTDSADYKSLYNELLPKYQSLEKSSAEFTALIQKQMTEKAEFAERVLKLEEQLRLAEFASLTKETPAPQFAAHGSFAATPVDPVANGNRARAYIAEQRKNGVRVSIEDALDHVKRNF